MKYGFCILLVSFMFHLSANGQIDSDRLLLNGEWDVGFNRQYTKRAKVPGLVTHPGEISKDTLWYRKKITLPSGNWEHVSLELMGARFSPSIFVNGDWVASENGGMAPISVLLDHPGVTPDADIIIEIALLSLNAMPDTDASKIPPADLWRSNVSSLLWDDVVLRLHGRAWFKRVISWADIDDDAVFINYEIESVGDTLGGKNILLEIIDQYDQTLVAQTFFSVDEKGELRVKLNNALGLWTPENPELYRLKVSLVKDSELLDINQMNYGHRNFKVDGLQFYLNNKPTKLRAASVVWHRWVRDPESFELAWCTDWFEENIVLRLKEHGANTLRFHLGMPPQRFLDLCDKHGLMVQAEWSFFHGMRASLESLLEQWPAWFDLCMRHPSIVLMHGWNETENPEELDIAFNAVDKISQSYPQLVIGHRDVIHVHKYWWSLFENLGLYYDSHEQFPLPVMADEFGGNYLDGYGNMGLYPMVPSAFRRFLGENHTAELRLNHQTLANARIAEYWRRLDVAGFSPFCALGPPEDGNHWFMGPLEEGNPKPVWQALTAAYAPLSVSLELWDRNFIPSQSFKVRVYFFNDTDSDELLRATINIVDKNVKGSAIFFSGVIEEFVQAFGRKVVQEELTLPDMEGDWEINVGLNNSDMEVKYPIVSSWDVRTFRPSVPGILNHLVVGVADGEEEIEKMLTSKGVQVVKFNNRKANVLVTGRKTWELKSQQKSFFKRIERALNNGKHVVMLDVGPQYLGQGYYVDDLGPLQGVREVYDYDGEVVALPFGLSVKFREIAEPESHIHPSLVDSSLWRKIPLEATWLWNGLRGGIIVPAAEMELHGLSRESIINSWVSRGGEREKITGTKYFAYELEGFYGFSEKENDSHVIDSLKNRVAFLVEDAPALKLRVNPDAPVKVLNLSKSYELNTGGKVESFVPLALAGNDLVKTPVCQISFGPDRGKLILSQMMVHNRLLPNKDQSDLYDIRYDPVAVQMVLNMLSMQFSD